jgi:hypothetical protein
MGVQSVWARSLYGRAVEGRANGMGTQLVWARNWYGHAIGMGMQLVWACNWYGHANGMGMQLVWACNLYGTQLAGMQLAQTHTRQSLSIRYNWLTVGGRNGDELDAFRHQVDSITNR